MECQFNAIDTFLTLSNEADIPLHNTTSFPRYIANCCNYFKV